MKHRIKRGFNFLEQSPMFYAFRRYQTIEWLYLSTTHLSESEIAKYYKVDRSVINRDKDRAINELSVLLFGIDAILDGFTSR